MSKPDGGPAFPIPAGIEKDVEYHNEEPTGIMREYWYASEGNSSEHPGMSLRDYFASQVMAGDAAADNGWTFNDELEDRFVNDRVALYYRIADAMIAERAKTG